VRADTEAPRTLLVRAGALGDVLLLRTALATLKGAGLVVDLMAPADSGAALIGPGEGEASRLLAWDRPEAAPLFAPGGPPSGPWLSELRRYRAIVAYSRSEPILAGLRAIGPRVIAHPPRPPEPGPHVADWLAEAVRNLAPRRVAARPLRPVPAETGAASSFWSRLPTGFLAIHPGSGSPLKNWPQERFAAVADALRDGREWLLVEGPADASACARLRHSPGALTISGQSPRVLGAVLSRAGLYVGNDSGVSHLAAAWDAPTLALFGPTDPRQWAPVGADVDALRSDDGTMEGLATAQVLAAAKALRAAAVSRRARPCG
jgi:heptosyltransferase-3